jgi:hypothetical protein
MQRKVKRGMVGGGTGVFIETLIRSARSPRRRTNMIS